MKAWALSGLALAILTGGALAQGSPPPAPAAGMQAPPPIAVLASWMTMVLDGLLRPAARMSADLRLRRPRPRIFASVTAILPSM